MLNYPAPDQYEWDAMVTRPVVSIPIFSTAANRLLSGRPCILMGWSLRDVNGAITSVELIDGLDVNGGPVAEVNIPPQSSTFSLPAQTDVDASSANAAAANNVTLPGAAAQTTFITGFEITGNGATAAGPIAVTVTGILGGTKTYVLEIPTIAGVAQVALVVEYARPIPASAVNTAIVVNVPSFGAGNTAAAVTAHGFQQFGSLVNTSQASSGTGSPGPFGALCRSGLFMRVVAGQVQGAVWVKV